MSLLSSLSSAESQHPFYPLNRFAVYKSGLAKARSLKWPDRLWISHNFFRSNWSLRSYRRLKNVVCAMEWQPPLNSAPMQMGGSAAVKLTDEGGTITHRASGKTLALERRDGVFILPMTVPAKPSSGFTRPGQ